MATKVGIYSIGERGDEFLKESFKHADEIFKELTIHSQRYALYRASLTKLGPTWAVSCNPVESELKQVQRLLENTIEKVYGKNIYDKNSELRIYAKSTD